MNEEQIKALIAAGASALTPLAQTLGTTAEHVYEVLVFQARVQAITSLAVWIPDVLLMVASIFLLMWSMAEKHRTVCNHRCDGFVEALLCLVGGSVIVGVFIALGMSIADAVPRIINPEYYAIKELLSVFGRR